MGTAYTSLSWYLRSENPTPKFVSTAKGHGSEYALELDGCHTRAQDASGVAEVPPRQAKSLTGDRARLGTQFVDTELPGVRIRRPVNGELTRRLSQVIFRVADLRKAFG